MRVIRRIPRPIRRSVLKTIKRGLIYAALVIFFADFLAAVWPAFEVVWSGSIAHVGVAFAALAAVIAERLHDEAEAEHDAKEVLAQQTTQDEEV